MHREYAFAPPHRVTLSRPCASDKTLCDVTHSEVTLRWSYESLRDMPVNVWKTPHVEWGVEITAWADGKRLPLDRWERLGGWYPGFRLESTGTVSVVMEGIACEGGDVVRIVFANDGDRNAACQLVTEHRIGGWVVSNPAWVDGRNPHLLECMQNERPDRLLVVGLGADEYPLEIPENSQGEIPVPMASSSFAGEHVPAKTMTMAVNVAPKARRTVYLLRPYSAYEEDAVVLKELDPERLVSDAMAEWDKAIGVCVTSLGDEQLLKDYKACLSDLLVMTETDAAGNEVATPGTEYYRSPNGDEPCLAAMVLDRVNLSVHALRQQKAHLESQGADGNWNDPKGWTHHCYNIAGIKANLVMEYYLNHRDRAYLEQMYPRMLASSRWNERMRAATRTDPEKATYGLMPRGMGDCGLMNGKDYFGVYYPINFYAVRSDECAMQAARILGRDEEAEELLTIWERALCDLRASLKKAGSRKTGKDGSPARPARRPAAHGARWGRTMCVTHWTLTILCICPRCGA